MLVFCRALITNIEQFVSGRLPSFQADAADLFKIQVPLHSTCARWWDFLKLRVDRIPNDWWWIQLGFVKNPGG